MTTARKKARTAARQVDAQGDPQATTEQIADAASDVWEPIVELLREALICADHVDWGLSPDDAAKVREILGNGAPRR